MERTYDFVLTGQTDLLMHRDDVLQADELSRTRKEMKKEERVAGDDRSPAWTWHTYTYEDGEHVAMDSTNVMASIRHGATRVLTGKGNKTFKELSQSGIAPATDYFAFHLHNGKRVPWAAIDATRPLRDFMHHVEAARKMGFDLHVKRARVGQSKHVRVRPRFRAGWKVKGRLLVIEPLITDDTLLQILTEAGKGGLGDWRPSSPTPGTWGRFTAEVFPAE